jgi:D-arabinose 1-dehydrogenase-like Zn-dependent alcohol dehydrogenase
MRAAVLTEINKPLQILDLEQEPPRSKEVRVRVKAAGVCMSDWHIMNGDWPLPLPMVLGHEAAGVVVEIGPDVDNVRPGDHVIFSFRPHCGRCRCGPGQAGGVPESPGMSMSLGSHTTLRRRKADSNSRSRRKKHGRSETTRIFQRAA